jgi:ferredoxin-NADP reductase
MRARIKEKQEVAKGTLFVTFDLLGEDVDFKPGQYFFVTLPDVGHQDDRGLRRHITVVTSPNEKGVLGFATRMRDSAFKRSLDELPVGTEVEVEPPKGSFALPEDTSRPLVFVAGGIGITVFRSMLLFIREGGLPHRVTLVYSNRDRESTAFLDEFQGSQDPKLHVASSRPVIVRFRADTGNDCGGTDSWAPSRNLIGERPRPAASRSKEATCQPSSVSPW